ncbi:MAG: beta-lactamase family protein [Gorillibacterium sp.]|nr:beta-lactamase family protein [Gorillibacterium sp.]
MSDIQSDLPENHGLASQALLDFFAEIERLHLEVNSFMLLQDGKVTAQFWRKPYDQDSQQLLFSLSKSFTSIAVGMAWDCGYLDLHDKVISFFPNECPDPVPPHLAKMTIHHLLSMNAGHHDNIYSAVVAEQDWVKTFLALDVEHEPGSYYRYSTFATHLLAAIVEKVTGRSLVDFLMPRLFEPLGIPRPSWEKSPLGIVAGGMGLSISTAAIARFGQMLLNKGTYEGQRIVSAAYIALATTEHSDNRREEEKIDSAQGYGYQFFLCRRGCFMGNGAFGQMCFVAPQQRIVIAVTASFASMKRLQILLDLIYVGIIDRLDEEQVPNPDDNYRLEQYLAHLAYPVPLGSFIPEHNPIVNDRWYTMNKNPQHLVKLNLSLSGEQLVVQMLAESGEPKRLLFNFTKPVHSHDVFIKDLSLHQQEVATYALWEDDNTLKLTLFYIETPYIVVYTVTFIGFGIELSFQINVSFTLEPYRVTGRISD